ncbi:MAG TPA: hypothetical protein VIT91_17430 [Chthoniobacterales bacterium]
MAAVFRITFLVLTLVIFVRADNAVPLGTREVDGKTLTIFAHPAPLRAGPVQLGVMLTDSKTGKPDLNWTATGSIKPAVGGTPSGGGAEWIPPCCRMTVHTLADGSVPLQFTDSSAGNALMRGASATLSKSGTWIIDLELKRPDGVMTRESLGITVGPPAAPVTQFWPLFAIIPVAVFAFVFSRKQAGALPVSSRRQPAAA